MPAFLESILRWLNAGYPEGVPATDYQPLFALLGTQLTDLELMQVADELAKQYGAAVRDWSELSAALAAADIVIASTGAQRPVLTKEMMYLAVSVSNGCGYCIASHGAAARKAGMTEAMFGELMAVVGMANETNRLANGYRVPIDPMFEW